MWGLPACHRHAHTTKLVSCRSIPCIASRLASWHLLHAQSADSYGVKMSVASPNCACIIMLISGAGVQQALLWQISSAALALLGLLHPIIAVC